MHVERLLKIMLTFKQCIDISRYASQREDHNKKKNISQDSVRSIKKKNLYYNPLRIIA